MANELGLTLGVNTITIPLKGTQVQIRARLRRFVIREGIDISQMSEAQIGRAALWLMVAYATARSADQQSQELLEVEKSRIAAAVASENDMLDPLT